MRLTAARAVVLAAVAVLALLGVPASAGPERDRDAAVSAYFFGDSLMNGTGASPVRPVMARVAAARLGWDVHVDAWGGTGYTTTGRSPGYLERLQRPGALAGRYDVVLLEGGYNDWRVGASPDALRAAVTEVVELVRERQPQARIVLMGSYDPPGRSDPHRTALDAVIRAVAREQALPFFSPLSGGWTVGQPPGRFLHADGLHPNAYGYGVMGARLTDELRALDLP